MPDHSLAWYKTCPLRSTVAGLSSLVSHRWHLRLIDSQRQRVGRASCLMLCPSLKEHLFVSSIILTGRGLCKVTPAMPTWVLSPEPLPDQPAACEQINAAFVPWGTNSDLRLV